MRDFFKSSLIVFIAFLAFLVPSIGDAALRVVSEPGTDPTYIEMAQNTVNAFNNILQADMGLILERDVNIFICPTRESYRKVLERELSQSPSEAERISKVTGGFSRGQSNAVAVHFDLSNGVKAEQRAYFTVAHELFHQVQYQLAKENMGKSYNWMKEGTADLIGATVAEKLGYQSLDKWKLDQVNILRKAEEHVSPQAILNINLDQWTAFIEQKQYPYEMSDLMVLYLQNQGKEKNEYRAIADYFRLIGQGVQNQSAFERAFGVSPLNLIGGFQAWFAEISGQTASIEIVSGPDVPAEYIEDFNRGAELTRQFFVDNWGKDITSSMRFVLTTGKPAYSAAMVKEFGISTAEAEERAKNSVWWYSGSTTIYEMSSLSTKQQRIFSIATSLIERFEHETAPQKSLEQLYWLVPGSTDAVASLLVDRSGASTMAQYRNRWLATVRKAGAFPEVSELSTLQSWNQGKAKYGATVLNRVASLAGLYLVDKHGVGSIINWCKAVKESGNAETAFQQVFGITTAQFSAEFSDYLNKNSKSVNLPN